MTFTLPKIQKSLDCTFHPLDPYFTPMPRRLKASFLATASVLTRTSSSSLGWHGATKNPRNLVAMGGIFGQVGDVDILPGLAPQVIGDKGRKVTKQPSIRMELMFFHKVTMLQCYNFVGNRKRI